MTLASITTLAINLQSGSVECLQDLLFRNSGFVQNPSDLKEDHLRGLLPNGNKPGNGFLSLHDDDFDPLIQIFYRILFELPDTDKFHLYTYRGRRDPIRSGSPVTPAMRGVPLHDDRSTNPAWVYKFHKTRRSDNRFFHQSF